MAKNVLVIGSGGREHALGWKLGQSPQVGRVFYAPGNGGTEEGRGVNVDIDPTRRENFPALLDLVKRAEVDLTVVGSEESLDLGIVDYFNAQGNYRIFGPTKSAARLEADKFFSHDLMKRLGIPQAKGTKCFNTGATRSAINWMGLDGVNPGIVIKARGLTAGKGVGVFKSIDEGLAEIDNHAEAYGPEVLISERLEGEEFSVFGISKGNMVLPITASFQDHKRLLDGDKGPNTGGMGAYGPVPFADALTVLDIGNKVMTPVVQEMRRLAMDYKGFLYAGMMMTAKGPKVLEFNARFGDPECQPAMMLLNTDLYKILDSALNRKFVDSRITFNPGATCCVVLASQGYPDKIDDKNKNLVISGLEEVARMEGVKVFHAGTKREGDKVLTNGGRVLGVTGYSSDGIDGAVKLAYAGVEKLNIPGGFVFRKDIAGKALGR